MSVREEGKREVRDKVRESVLPGAGGVGGKRSEVGGQRTKTSEGRRMKLETGDWRLETGNWKRGSRRLRLET
jgi:hypothetical protein